MKGIVIMASSAGSGKDTVAEKLHDRIDKSVKISLGGPIHEFCAVHYQNNLVPRNILQKFGESVRNIFGEDVWIKHCDESIKNLEKYYDKNVAIISDVRKWTEFAHYVVELGYLPIYVKVDFYVAMERLLNRDDSYDIDDLNKSIETQLNFIEDLKVDSGYSSKLTKVSLTKGGVLNDVFIIDNNGSLEDLDKQIDEWMKINHDRILA